MAGSRCACGIVARGCENLKNSRHFRNSTPQQYRRRKKCSRTRGIVRNEAVYALRREEGPTVNYLNACVVKAATARWKHVSNRFPSSWAARKITRSYSRLHYYLCAFISVLKPLVSVYHAAERFYLVQLLCKIVHKSFCNTIRRKFIPFKLPININQHKTNVSAFNIWR